MTITELLQQPISNITIIQLLEEIIAKSDSEIDWMTESLEKDKARAKDREENVENDAMYRFTDGLLHKEIAYNAIFKSALNTFNKMVECNENEV